MRAIEIRRHSIRGAGPHLSDAGRRLAERVRETMIRPVDLVLSSDKPRARETAEAMGFTVDVEDPSFGVMDMGVLAPWHVDIERVAPAYGGDQFAAAFHVPAAADCLREYATAYLDTVRRYLDRVPDGGRLLLISHGGTIEQVAALCLPEFSLEAVGGAFAPCEGFTLHWSGAHVVSVDIHRLPLDA